MSKTPSNSFDNTVQNLDDLQKQAGAFSGLPIRSSEIEGDLNVVSLNMYQSLISEYNTQESAKDELIPETLIVKKRSDSLEKWKKAMLKVISSRVFFILIVIANIYAIFITPLSSIIFTKTADPAFDTLTVFAIAIFFIEISLQLFAVNDYFLSFYFFIDIISTIVLFFDLTFVFYPLFYGQDDGTNFFAGIKILRVVRVLRLVRIMKLVYKYGERKGKRVKPSQKKKSEAEITRILKESNLRKLIVLILVILIAIPFFESSVYINVMQTDLVYKAPFILSRFLMKGASFLGSIKELQKTFANNSCQLIYLRIDNQLWSADEVSFLRPSEWNRYRATISYEETNYNFDIIINIRYQAQMTSLLLFLNTFLVTAIMAGSVYSLNKDMSDLVLNPLERMIQKVKEVSRDPSQVLKIRDKSASDSKSTNETLFIESAISKISQLLVLGFGQAGCKIISYYLQESGSELDDKIPGMKIHAIFGFCDIRQFTDATEVLLEGVTTFVNSIAEIVHQAVDTFGGAANKNIGDAFLLVWKLHDEEDKMDFAKNTDDLQELSRESIVRRISETNANIAEMALLSFVKIIININTLPSVVQYSQNPSLIKRIPNFSVKMGFGLHEGWAIEGAIGSQYKIDASYLSPNVNLASRLEAATKQFRTEILFSGNVFRLFRNAKIRSLCRHIDTVTVKGSIHPLRLYTIDLNISAVDNASVRAFADEQVSALKVRKEIDLRAKFNELSKRIISNDFKEDSLKKLMRASTFEEKFSGTNKILNQKDFAAILNFPDIDMATFRIIFSHALDNYIAGKWEKAREYFTRCLRFKKEDGPTTVIFEYMDSHNFVCPHTWKNCRELVDK